MTMQQIKLLSTIICFLSKKVYYIEDSKNVSSNVCNKYLPRKVSTENIEKAPEWMTYFGGHESSQKGLLLCCCMTWC